MKYLSFLILLSVIFLSQLIFNNSRGTAIELHNSIQIEIQNFIQNYVHEHIPTMSGFKIRNLYTEILSEQQIKVYFDYIFETTDATEGQTRQELGGTAIINQMPDDKWSLDQIQINDEKLEFTNPVIITPDPSGPKEPEEDASEHDQNSEH
jgi:hypothetical protein